MASSDNRFGGMVIGESKIEGRAVRSSVRWRLGLEVRFALPVAVKMVRSDTTTLLERDAVCPEGKLSSLRCLLLGLGLRRGLLSMSHGEASRARFGGRGVAAGDFGGVRGRNGDAMSAGSGEARSQSRIRLKEGEEQEGEEEAMAGREWDRKLLMHVMLDTTG